MAHTESEDREYLTTRVLSPQTREVEFSLGNAGVALPNNSFVAEHVIPMRPGREGSYETLESSQARAGGARLFTASSVSRRLEILVR
jgi:hypothetical protein